MLRQLLASGSFAALILTSGLPAQAQMEEPTPEPQTQESPQPEPQVQETPEEEISSEELQKFANAVKQLQAVEQESETQMIEAIQSEGLSEGRFLEIRQIQQNPEAEASSEITQEEKEGFETAMAKLSEIQQETQVKMKQVVQSEGLEVGRFNQIMQAAQSSPELRQEVQQMIQ